MQITEVRSRSPHAVYFRRRTDEAKKSFLTKFKGRINFAQRTLQNLPRLAFPTQGGRLNSEYSAGMGNMGEYSI